MSQDRETIQIETPKQAHQVTLKKWLTGREKREIDSTMYEDVNMDFNEIQNQGGPSISGKAIEERQDECIKQTVISVNEQEDDVLDKVLNMRAQDYQFVLDKVEDIVAPVEEDEDGNKVDKDKKK